MWKIRKDMMKYTTSFHENVEDCKTIMKTKSSNPIRFPFLHNWSDLTMDMDQEKYGIMFQISGTFF